MISLPPRLVLVLVLPRRQAPRGREACGSRVLESCSTITRLCRKRSKPELMPVQTTCLGRSCGEERHAVVRLVCFDQMQDLVALLARFSSALLLFTPHSVRNIPCPCVKAMQADGRPGSGWRRWCRRRPRTAAARRGRSKITSPILLRKNKNRAQTRQIARTKTDCSHTGISRALKASLTADGPAISCVRGTRIVFTRRSPPCVPQRKTNFVSHCRSSV